MIKLRHEQPSLWTGILKEELDSLWEPWMRVADTVLEDEGLVDQVYEAQWRRHPQSRRRGREQTPAEVALRMLLLKHVRNWSYEVSGARGTSQSGVSEFLSDRDGKGAGCQDLGKNRAGAGARGHCGDARATGEAGAGKGGGAWTEDENRYHGVETNIHYPTDSRLLQDGTRVLTRGIEKDREEAGGIEEES